MLLNKPGRDTLHPLLVQRKSVNNTLVVVITGDRGLAGAYNSNVIRFVASRFDNNPVPVKFIAVGRKGRDLLFRRRKNVMADFSNLPAAPTFADVSAIGRLAVDEFMKGEVDEVPTSQTTASRANTIAGVRMRSRTGPPRSLTPAGLPDADEARLKGE